MKLVPLVMLAFAVRAFAQNGANDDWEKFCNDVRAQPLSAPKFDGPLKEGQLEQCDARGLYYGFGGKPDYAAALQCAWHQRASADGRSGTMFDGVGVLTMLYANGRGVARNFDLAIRFACEQPFAAPAEMEGRLDHLRAMKAGENKSTFDLCDDITSGFAMGMCESVSEDSREPERRKKRDGLTAKLTPEQKKLYDKVFAAEGKFEDARTGNEIDLSGTARAMFALADLGKLRDQFIINLERFGKSDVPQATADDVRKLDAQMNAAYQRIMKAPAETFEIGTVKRDGIRDTQRAWLPLREAWMAFAKATYPKLTAERVMAQLIRLRLHQLEALPIDLK